MSVAFLFFSASRDHPDDSRLVHIQISIHFFFFFFFLTQPYYRYEKTNLRAHEMKCASQSYGDAFLSKANLQSNRLQDCDMWM